VAEYFSLKPDSAKIRGDAIVHAMNVLDSTRQDVTRKFILDHLNTYPALQYMYFLRKVYGRDSLRVWHAALTPAMQQTQFGLRIANYLKVGDPLKRGDLMEDFAAFDKDGKVRRPSEYKGKYILLDFSTTYCGPCMLSVADMKKLTTTYSDKLAIVSLSGDGGVYSEAMIKYGVSGFPTFCLVDPRGKILSLWTGYGKNDDGTGSLETAVKKAIRPGTVF
jgi:peroxiredoxin